MKTVFSKTEQVCEVWALGEQAEARTSSNTRFRDDGLYSYGTLIARILTDASGERVALVSSERWSSTTSAVQGQARTAARSLGMPVFEVPSLLPDHDANLRDYEKEIAERIGRIEAAAYWYTADNYRGDAIRLIGLATLYARAFGIDWQFIGADPLRVTAKAERRVA